MDWIQKVQLPSWSNITMTLGVTIFLSFIAYHFYISNYWTRRGVPSPKGLPILGNLLDRFKWVIPELEKHYFDTYGKCYGLLEFSKPVFVCGDPAILKDLLIRDFSFITDRRQRGKDKLTRNFLLMLKGDEWRRARNTITPTFTSGKMKAMMPLIEGCVELLEKALAKASLQSDENTDIKRMFGCYTMDVVAKCAFGTETNAQDDGDDSFVGNARKFLSPAGRWRIVVFMLLPDFLLDLIGFSLTPPEPRKYLETAVKQIIKERKERLDTGMTRKDMLQLLIEAGENVASVDEENDQNELRQDYEIKDTNVDGRDLKPKKYLTDDEIVANAFLTLVAGYDTTSSLLTFAVYSLAMHPEIQERLRDEITSVYESNGGRLTYEIIATLVYLDAVISEILRIYPPFMRIDRMVSSDYEIKSLGLKFKASDIIRVPIYGMHHSADFYEMPQKFDPERFLPQNQHKLIPYTFMAFGAGPRNCIGMRFALLEAKFGLATILLKYRFSRSSKTPAKPDFSKAMIFLNPHEIFVKVEKL